MRKNNNLIYHIVMKNNLGILNKVDYSKNLDIKKYDFKIKYIERKSELFDSFKLPINTQCFFAFNTLFIIEDNIQFSISKVAEAVYFLRKAIFNRIEIELLYEYIKKTNTFYEQSNNIKLKNENFKTKNFMVRLYLFEEKVKNISNYSSFELMMLRSRNIISKIKEKDIVKINIDYLLNKDY